MKKLGFLIIIIPGLIIGLTSKIPNFLEKEVRSISGMNTIQFNNFLNKKHYLVKSWALDPEKMDPEIYKALYETLNYHSTIINKVKEIFN